MTRINDSNQGDETYPTWETKPNDNNGPTKTPNNSLSSENLRPTDTPSESIAFAEDYQTRSRKRESTTSASTSASQSRSRSRGGYDVHVAQQNVWGNDKEKQHKSFLKKAFEHKLVPEFLK